MLLDEEVPPHTSPPPSPLSTPSLFLCCFRQPSGLFLYLKKIIGKVCTLFLFHRAGLRVACFHPDTTKHTASTSSLFLPSLLQSPSIPLFPLLLLPILPLISLTVPDCLSVCESRGKINKLSVLVNIRPLNPHHPDSPSRPNLTPLCQNKLSVSSEKEISLQFHY